MRLDIEFTRSALEAVRRSDVTLDAVSRWLDDYFVDCHPERIKVVHDALGHKTGVVLVKKESARMALDRMGAGLSDPDEPTRMQKPCEGCLYTGREPDTDAGHGKTPGVAVCVHTDMPLLQRRSDARGPGGACGPEAKLRKAEPHAGHHRMRRETRP